MYRVCDDGWTSGEGEEMLRREQEQNPAAACVGRVIALAIPMALVLLVGTSAEAAPPNPEDGPGLRGLEANHFTATYYDETHLNPDYLLFTRPYSAPISFHLECWGEPWPFEGCKLIEELSEGATYSVRWESRLWAPASGEYTFFLADVDDGARLFLDGEPVIDQGWNWPDPDVRPSPQAIDLKRGWHEIIVDYEQRPQYVASLSVRWAGPTFEEEVIPLARRGPADIDLLSLTYTNPRGGRYPDPGETLVFHANYVLPGTTQQLEVTSVHFQVETDGASWEFDASESSDYRRAEWTIPASAPPGHYTVSCTLSWQATDGSMVQGSDSAFAGRNFPGPGANQFAVYQVLLGFLTSEAQASGAPPKAADPVDGDRDVRIGVIRDDELVFRASTTPQMDPDESAFKWRLIGPGRTAVGSGAEFRVAFGRRPGDYTITLSCLDSTRQALVKVIEVPPPNETDWADDHLVAAAVAVATGKVASDWARENEDDLGGGFSNGRADAARHAYWNALMALLMGRANAAEAGLAHERTNVEEGAPHNESVMDLENNAVGRDLGALTLSRDADGAPLRARGGKLQGPVEITPAYVEQALQQEPLLTLQGGLQDDVVDALDDGKLTILDDLSNEHGAGLLHPSDQ